MTSKLRRLVAATGLSVIVFFASANTASAVGVLNVQPAWDAAGVSTTVTIVAGISAIYSTINTDTVQLRDAAGNLVPVVVFAPGDESGNTLIHPIDPLDGGTTYHVIVKGGPNGIRDAAGLTMLSDWTSRFVTAGTPPAPGTSNCPCTIWNPSSTTAGGPDNDAGAVELGVRFRSDVSGFIRGVRFYKHLTNTGTHVGNLWKNDGTLLATGVFSFESQSGWQQLTFPTPVAIDANTSYIASYHTNTGHYAADNSGLFWEVYSPPLRAVGFNDPSGPNGVYRYGSSSAFPDQSWMATNYWVDVVFTPNATDPTIPLHVVGVTPAVSANGVSVTTAVTASISGFINYPSVNASTFELHAPSGSLVPATVFGGGETQTFSLVPSAALFPNTRYLAIVRGGPDGIKDRNGHNMAADYSWSFVTGSAPSGPPTNCPCTIWTDASTTAAGPDGDTTSVELGVKFRSDVAGYIRGVRFYKHATNTGIHYGSLWTATGTLLANAQFGGESASGWQQVIFNTPVAIAANTTYVASYHTSTGHYASNNGFFGVGVDTPPLHALRDGIDGPNGVYRYGSGVVFPNQTYLASNYWVDVIYSADAGPDVYAPVITFTSPVVNAADIPTNPIVTATFNEAMDPATITASSFTLRDATGALVPADVHYGQATGSAILTPSAPLAMGTEYTVTVRGGTVDPRVKDVAGNALAATFSWTFRTVNPPPPPSVCPCSLWNDSTTPAVIDNDPNGVEVGVRFQSDSSGWVTAIRFYKGLANTGQHVGSLWSNTGTLLGQALFQNESEEGWQTVTLRPAVAITANTPYVVSYHTNVGHYATSSLYFNAGLDNAPLHAYRSGVGGPNGLYRYGTLMAMPTDTYNATNYWVDVVFATTQPPDNVQPYLFTVTPVNNATGVNVGTVITATFSEMMMPSSLNSSTFELRDPSGVQVPATILVGGETPTVTLTPSAPLAHATTYTVRVFSGAKDLAGNNLASNYVWVFTTAP